MIAGIGWFLVAVTLLGLGLWWILDRLLAYLWRRIDTRRRA